MWFGFVLTLIGRFGMGFWVGVMLWGGFKEGLGWAVVMGVELS